MATISSKDIDRCPIRSLRASHYRADGSCRCYEDGPPRPGRDPFVPVTLTFTPRQLADALSATGSLAYHLERAETIIARLEAEEAPF